MSEQLKRQAESAGGVPVVQTYKGGEEEVTIDLLELLYRLLANWKLILASAIVFSILSAVITIYMITPLYKATSTIYVLSRRDSAVNLTDLNLGSALTQDYIKVFNMWEVHEKVIENLGLNYSYSEMRKNLSVVNTSNTRMLDISFTSPSPEEARDVANEYARVASDYIAETMSMDKPSLMSIALLPTSPVSPSRMRNIALGFLLGALLSAGIVTIRYLMDDKYKTAEDIRKYTGLNTLAAVPDEDLDDEEWKLFGGKKEL